METPSNKSGTVYYQNKVEATKAVWALMAYLSQKEIPNAIFILEGKKPNKLYMMRKAQAEAFLKRLPEVFYDEGHGLFLSKEVKRRLFKFHTLVQNIWFAEFYDKQDVAGSIHVKNEKIRPEVNRIQEELLELLKAMIE